MIIANVSEEASQHIMLDKSCFEALKTLKYLHESPSKMEIIQLMLKLFSLELKDNDPVLDASENWAIMHKIQASSMELELPLATFVNSLYLTHSNYLESLKASDKFKELTFDNLEEKIADIEKVFRKK